MENIREIRIKKLLYQSWYRGCKETDKIVGLFAKKYIHELSDIELDELEAILNENDNDIFDWLSNKREMPEEIKSNSIMKRLRNFIPAHEIHNIN